MLRPEAVVQLDDATKVEALAPSKVLRMVMEFDEAVAGRVHSLEVEHLIGWSFGTQIDREFESVGNTRELTRDLVELVDSYRWALSLSAHRYHDREDQVAVRRTTVSALFSAVREYNPTEGPPFLEHLSDTLNHQMLHDHGVPLETSTPSPTAFDRFVEEHHLAHFPPPPNKRRAKHLAADEMVFVLEADKLVPGTIQAVTDRDTEPYFLLSQTSPTETAKLQARLNREGSPYIRLADEAAGPDERADFEAFVNQQPGQPALSVTQLRALGRGPLWLYAKRPQLAANPEAEPSTALVATQAKPEGMIVRIKDETLLTEAALELIIKNPLYREIYMMGIEDDQRRSALASAIESHLQPNNQLTQSA